MNEISWHVYPDCCNITGMCNFLNMVTFEHRYCWHAYLSSNYKGLFPNWPLLQTCCEIYSGIGLPGSFGVWAVYLFWIYLISSSSQVEIEFADGSSFHLSAEFLRVYSPAADSKIRSVGGEKVISSILYTPCHSRFSWAFFISPHDSFSVYELQIIHCHCCKGKILLIEPFEG